MECAGVAAQPSPSTAGPPSRAPSTPSTLHPPSPHHPLAPSPSTLTLTPFHPLSPVHQDDGRGWELEEEAKRIYSRFVSDGRSGSATTTASMNAAATRTSPGGGGEVVEGGRESKEALVTGATREGLNLDAGLSLL